jgi:Holliday junction resolvasome RuvABC endonuclease subunit
LGGGGKAAGASASSVVRIRPARVKQAVGGRGGAQKNQVNFMVRAIIHRLPAEVPPTPPTPWPSA